MKNGIITSLLLLLFISGFSQNFRLSPSVKKEKLSEAHLLRDITPEFWRNLVLPYEDRVELEKQLEKQKAKGPFQESYAFPQQNHVYPQAYYDKIIDYVSVEISAKSEGKILAAESKSETLSAEQKNILNTADLGTDISIKVKFKYTGQVNDKPGSDKALEGTLDVTVIPETEAEFPDGFVQVTEYLKTSVLHKVSGLSTSQKMQQAIVKFTVNEEGQVTDAKIFRTSTDLQIDELLLDAINKMPKWKPAENSMGIKVKQEFSVPLGSGGC